MIDFLRNHFRYDTARSWNRSTSYACNMKITDLDLDCATIDRLFNLIRVPEFYDELRYLIANFNRAHDYLWQAAWNGRNGGYLVLYQGCREPTQYRSYCTKCGQKITNPWQKATAGAGYVLRRREWTSMRLLCGY